MRWSRFGRVSPWSPYPFRDVPLSDGEPQESSTEFQGRMAAIASATRLCLPGSTPSSVMATPPHQIPAVTTPLVPRRRNPSPISSNSPFGWSTPDRSAAAGGPRSVGGVADGGRGSGPSRESDKEVVGKEGTGDRRGMRQVKGSPSASMPSRYSREVEIADQWLAAAAVGRSGRSSRPLEVTDARAYAFPDFENSG